MSVRSGNPAGIRVEAKPADGYWAGGPVEVSVALHNQGTEAVKLYAVGVPWVFHHAMEFRVVGDGAFENRLWELAPPSAGDVEIPPGDAAGGAVDIARYLFDGEGQPIGTRSGTYRVAGMARLVYLVDEEDDAWRAEVSVPEFEICVHD